MALALGRRGVLAPVDGRRPAGLARGRVLVVDLVRVRVDPLDPALGLEPRERVLGGRVLLLEPLPAREGRLGLDARLAVGDRQVAPRVEHGAVAVAHPTFKMMRH